MEIIWCAEKVICMLHDSETNRPLVRSIGGLFVISQYEWVFTYAREQGDKYEAVAPYKPLVGLFTTSNNRREFNDQQEFDEHDLLGAPNLINPKSVNFS
jgi:hypothetical protein